MSMRRAIMVISALLFVTLLLVPLNASADPLTKSGAISKDDYERIYIGSFSDGGDRVVKVTTNASVDVYLITSEDFSTYPESFTPVKSAEKTTNARLTFKANSGDLYYLVIDNIDNGRSTDQVPTGDVTYEATYPNVLDVIQDDINTFAWTCVGVVVGVIVLIVVIVVVIIYVVTRKKKAAPPPPGAGGPVYHQQPQAGYQYQQQQPTGYQPPQPSPYEPPPPSPYEPPPPPPPY
jgi:hypothetical protein